MTITASDVIQDDDVRAVAEKIRNQYTQVRRAFRDHDGTDLDSNSFEFPVSDSNFDGEAIEVGEGDDYPRSSKDHSKVTAAYKKYGVEVTITDEAVMDSAVDIEMDAEEDLLRAEERRVETVAYNVLDANTNTNVGTIDANGNNNDTIEQVDLEKAKAEAGSAELSVSDLIIIGSWDDYADYISLDGFTRASELGDQVVEQGVLPGGDLAGQGLVGTALDMPVYLENIGNVSAGDAYVVDTTNFGWESERDPLEVRSYREEQKDQTVYKVRGRWDWVSTQSEANIKISS
jgi:hypothetical protein